MTLVEQSQVPPASLPIAEFREHLRLGTGFSDDSLEDPILERFLRAAIAKVENETGKALIARAFTWSLPAWRGMFREELPIAPVSSISELRILDEGQATVVQPATSYYLEPDTHRPALVARGLGLPVVPVAGRIEVDFTAGFAGAWDGVPPALAEAVFLLAADYHEGRFASGERSHPATHGVASLIAPYRPMRLFGRRG